MAWQLAAPHTWPAAILPVLVAVAYAADQGLPLSVSVICTLLVICVLMQAAVNTFNDYYDYVKGSDSADDNVDPTDAVLVYNNVNPKAALSLAIGFLAVAFLLGAYIIWVAGWIPLVIGVVGALFVVVYSAGKTPLSYLPLGELVSGSVMGGLIPLASYQALTGMLDARVLLWAVPTIIGVGLIMFTNNTCDLEKDGEAGRHTLSVMLGRKRSLTLYHALVYVWIVAIVVLVAVFFPEGLIVMPFMLLAAYPAVTALLKNPLVPSTRLAAMPQVLNVNIALGTFYAAAVFASPVLMLIL
ncbi:MAG: prenyltransferase [Gordonibacter sp.]|nr:prenyltransferase [Gordonibacter sp.]